MTATNNDHDGHRTDELLRAGSTELTGRTLPTPDLKKEDGRLRRQQTDSDTYGRFADEVLELLLQLLCLTSDLRGGRLSLVTVLE